MSSCIPDERVCDLFPVSERDKPCLRSGRRETVVVMFSSKGHAMMTSISCTIRSDELKYETLTTVQVKLKISDRHFYVISSVSCRLYLLEVTSNAIVGFDSVATAQV